MKNIKKLSILLAITLIITIAFSITAFAGDIKEIEENDKIYSIIPVGYELSIFGDDLAYSHENGNYIEFCVDENKFAPEGITALNEGQVEKVFEHYYLNEGELESINDYAVKYDKIEKAAANGYNCYYLTGKYAFSKEEIDTDFAYYFHAAVFATKEEIFIVAFESYEVISKLSGTDLPTVLSGIVLNGTLFEGDKPEKNADHDFSASPAYSEVVTAAQGALFGDMFEDESMVSIVIFAIVLVTIVPTLILIIVAIVLIVRYNKLKKTLKQCDLTYGSISQYNSYQHNYNGYGYNQPVNQPYQAPVNPAYNPNPSYQNPPQTPSYVANAVNNLGAQDAQAPVEPVQSAEADAQNNESVGE